MNKINVVLEGRYKGYGIPVIKNNLQVCSLKFTKENVASYTVIDETNKDQYSIWKGALGVALFGGFGAVAGIGGKNKKEYLIAIEWKDFGKSLIFIDDRHYKVFVNSMF